MNRLILAIGLLVLVGCEKEDPSLAAEYLREFGNVDIMRLDDLEAKKAKADQAKQEFANIEVLATRFYRESKGRIEVPYIEFTIRNGTDHAISHLDFVATLTSPDRSVPWEQTYVDLPIRGGLEPGETRQWKNQAQWWGETPADVVLAIEMLSALGAEGQRLFTAEFTEEEAEELANIRKLLAALKEVQETE